MEKHVLVIGASLIDTKGVPLAGLEPGTSNPGTIRTTRGGTARNVAENLSRLGADVILISAVGDDLLGERLLNSTGEAGVNLDYMQVVAGGRTGTYMALLEPDGHLAVALDDTSVMEAISSAYLYQHRRLFRDAAMLVVDGGMTEGALATAVGLAEKYGVPICADPSSTRLAYKLIPHLDHLHLAVPNEREAATLCSLEPGGPRPEDNLALARALMAKGVKKVVITRADFGFVYATSKESGYIPPKFSEMVDSTGTGDAIAAAIIFGMLNQMDTLETMRLGAAAAGITLQSDNTVVPDLTLELLYSHLTV